MMDRTEATGTDELCGAAVPTLVARFGVPSKRGCDRIIGHDDNHEMAMGDQYLTWNDSDVPYLNTRRPQ